MRWMHLRFQAPLAAFGGEMIDAHGVIRNVPAQSMLTGLLANALGWNRTMRAEHQALQGRIVFGAVWEQDVALSRMTDYQTAQLGKNDRAWTTRGVPAGRAGGAATYAGPINAGGTITLTCVWPLCFGRPGRRQPHDRRAGGGA